MSRIVRHATRVWPAEGETQMPVWAQALLAVSTAVVFVIALPWIVSLHGAAAIAFWVALGVAVLAAAVIAARVQEIRDARERDARYAAEDAAYMAYWADAR